MTRPDDFGFDEEAQRLWSAWPRRSARATSPRRRRPEARAVKIQAAVARARAPFEIVECELEEPRAREVRVKIEACGICRTDLSAKDHGYGTPLPAVLGHEGVGRVEALGPGVTTLAIGQRVVMSFGACGHCPSCRERALAYCERARDFNVYGWREDGSSPISRGGEALTGHFFGQSSFASHAVASVTNLVPIDDDLPAALMTGLACGVQTGVGAVVNVLDVGPRDVLAIFGCGTVGLSAVMAARIVGCGRILAVDRRADRLAAARALGATEVIDNHKLDTAGLARALQVRGGLTRAFDNTGSVDVIEGAFAALRSRGVLALAGLSPARARVALDANWLMSTGRAVRGTVEGDADPRAFIPRLINWYRRGQLPLEALVTTYPFTHINEAASDMASGRVIKPVLLMG